MKLRDFDLDPRLDPDDDAGNKAVDEFIVRCNQTVADIPWDATVGALFRGQVARTPLGVAVIDRGCQLTYAELGREAERIARFIHANGVSCGQCVGAVLGRSRWLVATLLGILEAGAVYLPLNPELPEQRLAEMIAQTGCRLLIGDRAHVRQLNTLQWLGAGVDTVLCVDSDDMLAEPEDESPRMSIELWDHAARTATSAIEASGWRHGQSGAAVVAAEMQAYVDNITRKLAPHLGPRARLLEIGCGSGLVMQALAPRVERYVGVDLSAGGIAWARRTAEEHGLANVRLHALAAHELDRLEDARFDVIVIASVAQSFPGLNYVRAVIDACVARLPGGGVIFVGHVWDPDRHGRFVEAVGLEEGGDALFVACELWTELRARQGRITEVVLSELDMPEGCTLSRYSYDVMLFVAPEGQAVVAPAPRKHQADRRDLDKLAEEHAGVVEPVGSGGAADTAIAYTIFTSGSTGRPKGVQVEPRSLINLLHWYRDLCAIRAGTRVLQVIPSSFDASIKNYLAPVLFGGMVVLLPEGRFDPAVLLDTVASHEVEVLNPGVPSMMYPVIELAAETDYRQLASLRMLALGGETPDMARLRPWLTHPACSCRVANIYGPTECTDIALWHLLNADELAGSTPPIGRPLPNLRAYILDDGQRPVPAGVAGELYLAGVGLACGYVRGVTGAPVEEGTARFLPDPFAHHFPSNEPMGERMYRTGDRAHRREDGAIVYLGRVDNQIKIRGVRIEPEEVEARLLDLEEVREAAVAAHPTPQGDLVLCAYLVLEDSARGPDRSDRPRAEGIRVRLATRLPSHMVPEHICFLERLPVGVHGKLDRARLPAPAPDDPEAPDGRREAAAAPRTPTEEALLAIWCAVLERPGLGIHHNFFSSGGHSLKTAVLATRVRRTLGVEFSIAHVYMAQTVAEQARFIEQARGGAPVAPRQRAPLHTLNQGGQPPVFCFPPISGLAWAFLDLGRAVTDYTVHAFDFLPEVDRTERYVETILAADQPGASASYCLVGYSAGGGLALEVAKALEAQGHRVARLVLFDSHHRARPPGYGPAAIKATVALYLSDPRFYSVVDTPYSQAEWARRIRAYCHYHGEHSDMAVIDAPIDIVLAEGSLAAVAREWRVATRARVRVIAGAGDHDHMLDSPHVGRNAALLVASLTGGLQAKPESPKER